MQIPDENSSGIIFYSLTSKYSPKLLPLTSKET